MKYYLQLLLRGYIPLFYWKQKKFYWTNLNGIGLFQDSLDCRIEEAQVIVFTRNGDG